MLHDFFLATAVTVTTVAKTCKSRYSNANCFVLAKQTNAVQLALKGRNIYGLSGLPQ
jgi:hypothetical protein